MKHIKALKQVVSLALMLAMLLVSAPQAAEAAGFAAIVTSSKMNVYSDKQLSDGIGSVAKHEIVTVNSYSGSVAKITYKGNSGYAKVSDMERVSDYGEKATVTSSGAKVYESASTSARSVSLKKGWTVYVVDVSGQWAKVVRDVYVGYTNVNWLLIGNQTTPILTATPAPTAAADPDGEYTKIKLSSATGALNVRKSASTSSAVVTTVKHNETVLVTDMGGEWSRIMTSAGKTGYVKTQYLANAPKATATPAPSLEDAIPATVTAASVKVYKTASTSGTLLGTLKKGAEVNVIRYDSNWAYIEQNGKYGYCSVKALTRNSDLEDEDEIPDGYAKVKLSSATGAMNVRKSASTSSAVVTTVGHGAILQVIAISGEWANVKTSAGKTGYVKTQYLEISGNVPTVTPTPAPTETPDDDDGVQVANFKATVTSATLKVYKSASQSSTLLGTLKKGAEVNVIAYNSTMAYIELNGKYGFCLRSGLTKSSELEATPTPEVTPAPTDEIPEGYAMVKLSSSSSSMYIRKSPTTSSTAVTTVKHGAILQVLGQTGAWTNVKSSAGKTGYVKTQYLEINGEVPTVTPTPTPSLEDAIPATVTAASVKVYKTASESSTLLGTLKKGAVVNVIDYNSTWAYIELNGNYGYCRVSALTRNSELEPENSTMPGDDGTVKFTATVIYPSMPVYASQSTSASSNKLSLGTTVNVYAYDDTWAYIGKGDSRGYALVKHLSKDSYTELTSGSSGSAVQKLQQALEELGYFDGVPGGNYSSMTTEAVKRFQSAVGLTATGTADEITLRILGGGYAPASPLLSTSLGSGSTGSNVTRLQTRLYNKGYLSKTSSVDGDYGSTTASAVKLFQAKAGITVTGTADSATLKALYKNSAPALGSGTPADEGGTADPGETGNGDENIGTGDSSKIEKVVEAAKAQLGKPYVYGATGMSSFDCSGLTLYAYKQAGITLKRTAYAQGYNDAYPKISTVSGMVRGDLVCMDTISDSDKVDHVGIYLGGGQFIHASSGGKKVIISNITSGYYNRVFSWARRIIK